MKRPTLAEWRAGPRVPFPGSALPFAPVRALFYGSALVVLVVGLAVLEGVVALADAVEAYRRG